jgi:beta-aspartyl-dipeptidase (metallo-type)
VSPEPDFLLVEGGELYAPAPHGRGDVLIACGRIVSLGATPDTGRLEVERLDATNCVVVPGLLDPHEHLIGGSGERGFQSQTPEIFLHELIEGAVTTVVGCLGVDNVTRNMPALLAKVKGLRAQGLSAYLYTGGYSVPPATLTASVRNDILFVEEAIGAGETAIADDRSSRPSAAELARLASDAYTGGILSGKAGILHLHTGGDARRLADVRALLDEWQIPPETLYPTHVERTPELFDEAVALAKRGVTVDVDVIERDLALWVRRYREQGGPDGRLTASSDAAQIPPALLLQQVADCVLHNGLRLEDVLPLVTSNTAAVLKLKWKGRLATGCDGDIAVLDRGTLTPRHVIAGGRVMMRDGVVAAREAFLDDSTRRIHLNGTKKA